MLTILTYKIKFSNHFKLILACLTLILISINSMAQNRDYWDGYIVTTKDDTIRGKIKEYSSLSMQYIGVEIIDEQGKKRWIKTKHMKEYKRGNDLYVTKRAPKPDNSGYNFIFLDSMLLKIIDTGSINLYRYDYSEQVRLHYGTLQTRNKEITVYYLQRNNSNLELIKKKKFRESIVNYLRDYKELVYEVANKRYKFEHMHLIVSRYNEFKRQGMEK